MCFGCYTRFIAGRRVGQADFEMERGYALGAAGDDEDKLFWSRCFVKPPL